MDTRTVSTENRGIMEEIREHLAEGKSSGEVIALGYKPPTVFKVQRWLRRRGQGGAGTASVQGKATTPRATVDTRAQAEVERLVAENEELRAQVERLEEEEADEADILQLQLDEAQAQVQDLQGQVKTLQMKLSGWQEANGEWRKANGDLERKLSAAKATLDDTERRLRAMKEEDTQLRAYLKSQHCGWEQDFQRYKEGSHCIYSPLPRRTLNQGGQQACGGHIALPLLPCTRSKPGS